MIPTWALIVSSGLSGITGAYLSSKIIVSRRMKTRYWQKRYAFRRRQTKKRKSYFSYRAEVSADGSKPVNYDINSSFPKAEAR